MVYVALICHSDHAMTILWYLGVLDNIVHEFYVETEDDSISLIRKKQLPWPIWPAILTLACHLTTRMIVVS